MDGIAGRIVPGARIVRRWPLQGGVSAAVEALELSLPDGSHRRVVVRRHGAADWKPLDADVTAKEYRLLTALYAAGLPVPEPLLVDETGELLPSPFLVLAWVEGTHEVSEARHPAAIEQMAAFLTALHAPDPTAMDLRDLPPREDPVTGTLTYLPKSGHDALRTALVRRGPLPGPGRPSLLHGDFWPGNLLWEGGRIAAVLDWEDAALGDPLSDVATARLELLHAFGAEATERFTRHYFEGRNADPERLAIWELYVATAMLASIHHWGLDPQREARMRQNAEAVASAAAAVVLGGPGS